MPTRIEKAYYRMWGWIVDRMVGRPGGQARESHVEYYDKARESHVEYYDKSWLLDVADFLTGTRLASKDLKSYAPSARRRERFLPFYLKGSGGSNADSN